MLAADSALGGEGYELTVSEQGVRISAATRCGAVLRSADLAATAAACSGAERRGGRWTLATGVIRDYPRYHWRGAMLDVARHFFSVDEVKRFIDLLAAYKMNVLQLHLSDDQGWRIEIASWPRLTSVGGTDGEVGGGEGGFYTQAQYREIVAYAAERFITVIPEIDLPGHTNAALVAYPELNCNGKEPVAYTGIEVGFSSLCTRKPVVMRFVLDVIRELAAMTPGRYIHIGGDEANSTMPRDYEAFVDSVEGIVRAQGKTMIGWEEIAQAPIDSGTIVQYWRSGDLAVLGGVEGRADTHVAIDARVSRHEVRRRDGAGAELGELHRGGYCLHVGSRHPHSPAGPGERCWASSRRSGPKRWPPWSEAEFLLFPRLAAIAEVAWSPAGDREWGEFSPRLGRHGARMTRDGDRLLPFAPRSRGRTHLPTSDQRALCRDRDRTFRSRGEDPCPARHRMRGPGRYRRGWAIPRSVASAQFIDHTLLKPEATPAEIDHAAQGGARARHGVGVHQRPLGGAGAEGARGIGGEDLRSDRVSRSARWRPR